MRYLAAREWSQGPQGPLAQVVAVPSVCRSRIMRRALRRLVVARSFTLALALARGRNRAASRRIDST